MLYESNVNDSGMESSDNELSGSCDILPDMGYGNENIEMYALHIAEDDGEVDMDFPSLDSREPVTKFGFSKLALVEKDLPPPTSPKSAFVVTVFVPNRGFNKFQVENMNITLKEILNKIIKRRKIKIRPGLNYNLEKQNEPGISLDLDATLASADTMEFCLVRENSTRAETITVSDETSGMADSLTSHQYKSFIVNMIHKLRANTEVQLGISGEKVEIDPVVGKGTAKFFKQRAVTHDADSIASCDIIEEKSTGNILCKAVFRLTYLTGHDYKHHDFETDTKTAKEIVHKINNILELKLSPIRKEYVSFREKKSNRRSFRDSFTSS
ncbi:hypothetical protein KUTeg_022443 [Tegillarca granosa]|uniref:Target of rapamycin complex 2 subunit MAPKAP1 n=1 Tax=Tegillarca granosa TaxID=220873 RepID=A0ABQ9E6F3_TEGGR|nr:hypothetical protein KUTeg_022443 [Tegillarca granosa]